MISNLNHNFNRDMRSANSEADVLIANLKSLREDIGAKTNKYNSRIQEIFEKWDNDVSAFSESFGEAEKDLVEFERGINNSLEERMVDFIDDEGILAEIEQG